MRLSFSKSKNSTSLYVIKSTYENGMRSSKIVEKLGTLEELNLKLNGQDPIAWAKKHVEELNRQEKENKREIAVRYSPVKIIDKDVRRAFNGGYLFFEQIYHELGIDKLCQDISRKYNLSFDLSSVLPRLVYSSIVAVSGGHWDQDLSATFMHHPVIEDCNFCSALEVIANEAELIENALQGNNLIDFERNVDKINKRRQEIDKHFLAVENEFPALHMDLSWEDRQKACTMVCLVALAIGNCLERKLGDKYTYAEIIRNLRSMNFFEVRGEGYIPTYMRTDFTDDLHEAFGFRTDYQIVSTREMEKIIKKVGS